MTDEELRKYALYTVEAQLSNPEWMLAFARAQAKVNMSSMQPRWINSARAAEILGIGRRTLREIKDNFTYTKSGNSRQGSIYFDANTLQEEYDRFVSKQNRTIRFIPQKVVGL